HWSDLSNKCDCDQNFAWSETQLACISTLAASTTVGSSSTSSQTSAATSTAAATATATPANSDGFVTQSGTQLLLDGKPFRFASHNIPGLLLTEDRGGEWVPPTLQEQEDALLSISLGQGRVARTYTLGFGPNYHVTGFGQFHEPAWVAFDNALALARNLSVKLIVPLINNHNDGSYIFGDYEKFTSFGGKPASAFYSDATIRQEWKKVISYTLGRVNTVNGIKYSEDSTILAWELGNELGGWDAVPPSDWTLDIAKHIKSLAPRTLVMDGTIGYSISSKWKSSVLDSPDINIFTNHYYGGSGDLSRVAQDTATTKAHGKAFIVGEFGFDETVMSQIMDTATKNANVAGTLTWSLRYHSRD
ncbi:hypothetical protein HDU91_002374, partial [Kappamyces sp. JEL0680]